MTDTYVRLSSVLLKSRTRLLAACKELNIDISDIDPQLLQVRSCDNCSFWDKPGNMNIEPDDTTYCRACTELEYLRF
jgi:hypothetical protein